MLLRKLQAREQSKHIQYGSRLINGTHTHVDYRVTSLVSLMIVFYTQPPFKGDQKQKNRNQQGDVIGHIFSFYEFPPTQKHRCTENHNHPNKNYGKLQLQYYNSSQQTQPKTLKYKELRKTNPQFCNLKKMDPLAISRNYKPYFLRFSVIPLQPIHILSKNQSLLAKNEITCNGPYVHFHSKYH